MKKSDYVKVLLAGIAGATGADALSADTALEAKLDALAKSAPPTKLSPGAMCYVVAPRKIKNTPAEYVCPTCQQKTLFERDSKRFDEGTAGLVEKTLPQYRTLLKHLQPLAPQLKFALDEKACCWYCTKDLKKVQKPEIYLVVTHPDGTIHRTALKGDTDFKMLIAFFDGKDRYRPHGEVALKDALPRLHELLGIPEPKQVKSDEKK